MKDERVRHGGLILAIALMSSGCAEANDAYSENFEKSFAEKFVASCKRSLDNLNLPQAESKFACACTLKKTQERYPGMQKANLSAEQSGAISQECAEAWKKNG